MSRSHKVTAALDLRLLTSGATQHVFVRTDGPCDGWVYKTPALVDDVLPSPLAWRDALVGSGWKRFLLAAAVRAGARRRRWFIDSLRTSRTWPGVRARERALRLLESVDERAGAGADRLWALRARRARIRQFHRMCGILQRLAKGGAAGVVLPFTLIERRCTLRIRGRAHGYDGVVLRQRRADHFFEYFTGFERFCWDDLIVAQQCLWRHRVGLVDTDEVLGPRNWALLDGRLLLGDTGSLTDRREHVREILAPAQLDARKRQIPVWWPEQTSAAFEEYCTYVRRQISQDSLDRLWGSAHTV